MDRYKAKQSGGFLQLRMGVLNGVFILIYFLLIFTGFEYESITKSSIISISEFEVFIIMAGVVLQIILSVYLLEAWKRVEFEIDEAEVHVRSGILIRYSKSYRLDAVHFVDIEQSIIVRHFQFGTVTINFIRDTEPLRIVGVAFPDLFEERLLKRINV